MLLSLCCFLTHYGVEKIGIPHALSTAGVEWDGQRVWGRQTQRRVDDMKAAVRHQLDPTIRSNDTSEFHASLRAKIVGQEEGVQSLVDMFQVFCAGLNSPGRPVGNLLFLGPTGSGKTRIVEAAAEILFGDARAVIKVDCAEVQHSHEIAKLIRSPPGSLGHRETHPLITQGELA